jgi:hypothetical protein
MRCDWFALMGGVEISAEIVGYSITSVSDARGRLTIQPSRCQYLPRRGHIAAPYPPVTQATTALSTKILDGLFRERDAVDLLPRLLRAWEPGRFSAK